MARCLLDVFPVENVLEIGAVLVLLQDFVDFFQLLSGHPAVCIGDFLDAGDFPVLMGLDRTDKVRRIHEGFMRAGVQPGKALSEKFDGQLAVLKIDPVEVRDLKFASCGRLQVFLRS